MFCKTNHFAKLFMVYTSVLPKHLSVYNLSGLFIRIGEKLSQGYNRVHKSYLVIGNYKKKTYGIAPPSLFLVRPQYCPPPFFLIAHCIFHIHFILHNLLSSSDNELKAPGTKLLLGSTPMIFASTVTSDDGEDEEGDNGDGKNGSSGGDGNDKDT